MQDWDKWAKVGASLFGAVTSWLFGGWGPLLTFLFSLMVMDYITGCYAAAHESRMGKGRGLNSTVGLLGFGKKLIMLSMVFVAHKFDQAMGQGTMFRDGAAWGLCLNEALSLIENWGRSGLPTLPLFKQIVEVLKSKGGGVSP